MLFSLPDSLSFNSDQEELTLMQAVSRIGQNFTKALEGAFQNDGYSLQSVLDSDVLHPIDGYNLIKRTARTWIKVEDALQAFHKNSKAIDEETFLRQLHIALHRVILIQKILFLQLLHGFKLFHLVSDFQNSFCF